MDRSLRWFGRGDCPFRDSRLVGHGRGIAGDDEHCRNARNAKAVVPRSLLEASESPTARMVGKRGSRPPWAFTFWRARVEFLPANTVTLDPSIPNGIRCLKHPSASEPLPSAPFCLLPAADWLSIWVQPAALTARSSADKVPSRGRS